MKRMILFLAVAVAVPSAALADNRDNRTREDVRRDHEQRRYEAWERQRAREAADAKQGGRSGPGALGPEPYKNPRPSEKPARALGMPDFKK